MDEPPKEERKTWRDRYYEDCHREWAIENGWTPPAKTKVYPEDGLRIIVNDALECDGYHHVRWHLERLADLLDVPIRGFREGIAP